MKTNQEIIEEVMRELKGNGNIDIYELPKKIRKAISKAISIKEQEIVKMFEFEINNNVVNYNTLVKIKSQLNSQQFEDKKEGNSLSKMPSGATKQNDKGNRFMREVPQDADTHLPADTHKEKLK